MKDIIALVRGFFFSIRCRLFKRNVEIGSGLRIFKKLKLSGVSSGGGKIYIGNNCTIDGISGDNSQFTCLSLLSSDAVIRIGDNAKLHAARISAKFQVDIGDNLLMQESGIMDTDYHTIDKSRDTPKSEVKDKCRVTIGNNVCIGARSYITKGVTIGDDVVIAPGSIVAMSVKSGSRVIGNPAKIVE